MAGQLASIYFIPVISVPLLMITHFVAFNWLAAAAGQGGFASP